MKNTACTCAVLLCSAIAFADDWRTESDARIEQHRKESVDIIVTINGEPVKGAAVEVNMIRHEFLFGCNIFKWNNNQTQEQNEAYHRQFADIFNFATLPFYWTSYEWEKDKPDYASSERIADWCEKNGIRPKGHPLVWNTGDPRWIKNMPQDEIYQRLINRAETIPHRFAGKIDTWDVTNEVTGWGHKKRSPILTQLGLDRGLEQLAKDSFLAARKGNPKAVLIYNDYNTQQDNADFAAKLVGSDGQRLFDAVGIQSHMHSGVWNNATIREVCDRFAALNVPIHFTELTIVSTSKQVDWWTGVDGNGNVPTETDPAGERKQAEETERFYTMLFSHPSVAAITWWDFSDQGAWKNAPSGLLRSDMSPKPAYDVLKRLIKEKWATNVVLKTDAAGCAPLRAFRGEYRLTVTLPDGTKKTTEAPLGKGTKSVQIKL